MNPLSPDEDVRRYSTTRGRPRPLALRLFRNEEMFHALRDAALGRYFAAPPGRDLLALERGLFQRRGDIFARHDRGGRVSPSSPDAPAPGLRHRHQPRPARRGAVRRVHRPRARRCRAYLALLRRYASWEGQEIRIGPDGTRPLRPVRPPAAAEEAHLRFHRVQSCAAILRSREASA